MKIFIQFVIVFIVLNTSQIAFGQTGFTGWYQDDTVTIAKGGALYVEGTFKTNNITFNEGDIYVEADIENMHSTRVGFPNPVGSAILNGAQDQKIIGNWNFNELRLDKQSGNVSIDHNISIDSLLAFRKGNLYIDNFTVDLKNEGAIDNETNDNRVYAVNGVVTTTRHLQELKKTTDIAGLGIFIESPYESFGTTTITRGHTVFADAGSGSIARYFDIVKNDQHPVDAIKIRYFETDNITREDRLQFYSYNTTLPIWQPRGGVVNEVDDTIIAPYYLNLGSERITLAPASNNATCPHNDPNYVEAVYLVSTHAYALDTLYFVNVSVSNNATASLNYIWNFGDGTSSDVEDTFHIYQTPGIYSTTLQVSNGFCSDLRTKSDTITVAPPARQIEVTYGGILNSFSYYPNPCSGTLTVNAEFSNEFPSVISIFDMLGRKFFESTYTQKTISDQLPLHEYAAGMYIIELQAMGKHYTYKIIKD